MVKMHANDFDLKVRKLILETTRKKSYTQHTHTRIISAQGKKSAYISIKRLKSELGTPHHLEA